MKVKYVVYIGNDGFTDNELEFMHGRMTKNKRYEILNEYSEFYVIKNNDGGNTFMDKKYFITIEEMRNNKLNNLGI